MLRALLASLWLTALYARALTGAERRAPLRAKRTKRPPSSSAGSLVTSIAADASLSRCVARGLGRHHAGQITARRISVDGRLCVN